MSLTLYSRNLKHLRKKNNLTQQQVADFLNISIEAYQAYEQRKHFPCNQTQLELCNLFNFLDLYKMHTVDLAKEKQDKRDRLPGAVIIGLTQIKETINNLLTA